MPVRLRFAPGRLARYPGRVSQTVSAVLAPVVLPDPDGREVRLGSLWQDAPAVLVFLRHYG